MGTHASALFGPGTKALTHCNAGGLATGGYGSAVGALRAAWEQGLLAHVWVDETRPLLQGSRLTAWELEALGIPHAVIADSAAAHLMSRGEVDCVVTGADRIAANGDAANKIGTYGLAVAAAHHGLPLYIVAPTSTIDLATPTGAEIPIEERDGAELGTRFAARNPAFDVTPAALIAAIVTEEGVHRAPYAESLPRRGARMKAIILAGGYATRLQPLTDDLSKCLLPVGGRPMVDWILDSLRAVTEIDEVHLVTNHRFAPDFERWATAEEGVTVHDDGTTSNEDRLGAMGDVAFTLERAGIDDDVLVVAGDNLFDYSLADFTAFWRSKGVASAVAVLDVGDLRLASQYGVVDVADDERITSFVEKPDDPPSTLAATATYIYHRDHVPLVERYLAEGNAPDQVGSFIAWLHAREPVYAYRFAGRWLDIGDKEQLLAADNQLRRQQGLPERAEYQLEI